MICRRTIFLALAALLISGCGSATEVGNPTGQLPTTRTIKGIVDLTTIDTTVDVYLNVDPTSLTVQATATDGSMIDGPVETDAHFILTIDIGKSYAMEILHNGTAIGNFSFEQDDIGTRANRIRFDLPGEAVDLGEIQFRNRSFRPQQEPRFREGFTPFSGPPPPAEYYGNDFEYMNVDHHADEYVDEYGNEYVDEYGNEYRYEQR